MLVEKWLAMFLMRFLCGSELLKFVSLAEQ